MAKKSKSSKIGSGITLALIAFGIFKLIGSSWDAKPTMYKL
jgi:hypothetical protein